MHSLTLQPGRYYGSQNLAFFCQKAFCFSCFILSEFESGILGQFTAGGWGGSLAGCQSPSSHSPPWVHRHRCPAVISRALSLPFVKPFSWATTALLYHKARAVSSVYMWAFRTNQGRLVEGETLAPCRQWRWGVFGFQWHDFAVLKAS